MIYHPGQIMSRRSCPGGFSPATSHWGSIGEVLVPAYIARTLADTSDTSDPEFLLFFAAAS